MKNYNSPKSIMVGN